MWLLKSMLLLKHRDKMDGWSCHIQKSICLVDDKTNIKLMANHYSMPVTLILSNPFWLLDI